MTSQSERLLWAVSLRHTAAPLACCCRVISVQVLSHVLVPPTSQDRGAAWWQVGKARNHVQQGVTQLVEAKKLQKKTRKLMCCVLITILLIIIAIVLAVVKPWNLVNKNNAG